MRIIPLSVSLALALGGAAVSAQTLKAPHFTPELGEGGLGLRAVVANFGQNVAVLGQQSEAPFIVQCDDPEAIGSGRWLDARRWVFEFVEIVAPGASCTAQTNPAFIATQDRKLSPDVSYAFNSGGPKLLSSRPYYYSNISEDQAVVMRFAAPVDPKELERLGGCAVDGVGEMIPLQVVEGARRTELLTAVLYDYDPANDSAADQVVQCARLLPAGADVKFVIEAGLGSAFEGREPVRYNDPTVLNFEVRQPFLGRISCDRSNADAPCNPLLPINVVFSSVVEDALLSQVTLEGGGKRWEPAKKDADEYYYSGDSRVVRFEGPFPPEISVKVSIPDSFVDDSGRSLENAQAMKDATIALGVYPPLLKFASGDFGVIERFANAGVPGEEDNQPPAVPLTIRGLEAGFRVEALQRSAGSVHDYATQDDQEVLKWLARLRRLYEGPMQQQQINNVLADREWSYSNNSPEIDTRSISVFQRLGLQAKELTLPGVPDQGETPFEVIGVPLSEPGFHVLEARSDKLGEAFLADAEPMYVRTSALVTNLAVHMKHGRDDMLVWVTTLDDAQPVANAQVRVLDCDGNELMTGTTNADGVFHRQGVVEKQYCPRTSSGALYASARIPADHPQAHGKADFSFVLSDWDRGIEPWRFNVAVGYSQNKDRIAHTVLDRSLFRAGETVHMKHLLREQTRNGLENPSFSRLPETVELTHYGSGESFEQPLRWSSDNGGARAYSSFDLPKNAPLGEYMIMLSGSKSWHETGSLRIEEFKLPFIKGSIKLSDGSDSSSMVRPQQLQTDLQLAYVNGGAAGALPVTVSAVSRPYFPSFSQYGEYSFGNVRSTNYDEESPAPSEQKLFLNKHALVLDVDGGARVQVSDVPVDEKPQQWLVEASFHDPNGAIQTLSQTTVVWPSAVVPGIQADGWMSKGSKNNVKLLALDTQGQPISGQSMTLRGQVRKTLSVRKRLVGGFYSYDNQQQVEDLGQLCKGSTNEQGVLECKIDPKQAGEVVLVAEAVDAAGNKADASTSVWVSGGDRLWFGGENDDRIDLIPAKKVWAPGEEAEFQIRMPFEKATVLVSVEREGVLSYEIMEVSADNPVIKLPVLAEWGPNVFVSALVIRGRLRSVPWTSFFSWGWKQPFDWYDAWSNSDAEYQAPTATVDLSKPSYRLGLAEIEVRTDENQLQVEVKPTQPRYAVRETVEVEVKVTLPDGKPAAGALMSFAAVDEALLELSPNRSWDVVKVMLQPHSYGVHTATAQSEVVGRRHYGRKAIPAGGGGGKAPTRELLDTLLLWKGEVRTDDQGIAHIQVPLNDSLTAFKLVAIAEYGEQRFGTGSATILVTQDVQLISGLPEVVRNGDSYQATFTVRNSSEQDRTLVLNASMQWEGQSTPVALAPQEVALAAGRAQTVQWAVEVPAGLAGAGDATITWNIEAHDAAKPSTRDALTVTQVVRPAIPVQTQQGFWALVKEGKAYDAQLRTPEGALRDSAGQYLGGIAIELQSGLSSDLPDVRQWFQRYPYTCYEQQMSKAVALDDTQLWQQLTLGSAAYISPDQLLRYFPSPMLSGSPVLTAYILNLADDAKQRDEAFALPSSMQAQLLQGLRNVVLGHTSRETWLSPEQRALRQLMMIETLSRYQTATASMLDSITIEPQNWPVESILDWLHVLDRVPGIANVAEQKAKAIDVLRTRLVTRGSSLRVNETDYQWWLMRSPVTAQARLLVWAQQQPSWEDDVPLLLQALINMQSKGHWESTTDNVQAWQSIALLAQQVQPAEGMALLSLGEKTRMVNWATVNSKATDSRSYSQQLNWPETQVPLQVQQEGAGDVWALIRLQAAVPTAKPIMAGYSVKREVIPVAQAVKGEWTVGDVYKVRLTIDVNAEAGWTAVNDPVPPGAMILGSGLGRDSAIEAAGTEQSGMWPNYVERRFDAYQAYYENLPAGKHQLEYQVRLNTAGEFVLPDTKVEALYEPETHALQPNAPMVIGEAK